jgi:hypothetical protein
MSVSERHPPLPLAEQFSWLKQAISNQREVWDILMQLQQLTAKHALETLPGPPRGKRLTKTPFLTTCFR